MYHFGKIIGKSIAIAHLTQTQEITPSCCECSDYSYSTNACIFEAKDNINIFCLDKPLDFIIYTKSSVPLFLLSKNLPFKMGLCSETRNYPKTTQKCLKTRL